METVRSPDWLIQRWADVVKAAMEIGGWANEYSHGYIESDEGDFPADGPPTLVPLWRGSDDEETSWVDWPHKELYASIRTIGDTKFPGLTHEQRKERFVEIAMGEHRGPLGVEYLEFHFGTYNVFRVTPDELKYMNEGYEDQAGSENERILEDGDWRIVVYMS